jgi:hypothetical protein
MSCLVSILENLQISQQALLGSPSAICARHPSSLAMRNGSGMGG